MSSTAIDSFTVSAARSAQIEERIARFPGQFRVLTGDRPTGPLHLGHYFGTWPTASASSVRGWGCSW